MAIKALKSVRPDAKGRITLGSLAQGISCFVISVDNQHRIILEPRIEIAVQEKWLFDNKAALHQVKRGLEDSAAGRVKSRGRFKKYLNEKDDA